MKLPLPKIGQRFHYSYRLGGQWIDSSGHVTRAWYDQLGEVVVEVIFDDGKQYTFWNSSFVEPMWGSNEVLRLN